MKNVFFGNYLKYIAFILAVIAVISSTSSAQLPTKTKSVTGPEKPGAKEKNKTDAQSKLHAQIVAIEKYCKEIDANKKEKSIVRKTFATIDSGKKGTRKVWLEFKNDKAREQADTGENLNENAFVWVRKNKIVAATFTFQDASRKWVHFGFYYFRPDGTLAKLDEELDRDKIKLVRKSYFSEEKKNIAGASNYFDGTTKLPTAPKNFGDRRIPVYKSVNDLPFYKLLNTDSPLPQKKP